MLQSNRLDQALRWLLPGLIVVAGLSLSLGLAHDEHQAAVKVQRDLAYESLSRLSANLEQALHQRLSITTALGAFVQIHKGEALDTASQQRMFKQHFEEFSGFLDNSVPGILSMQLAPQGVVTYLTNEAANRKAIGHDLLVDDVRREQVIETIRKRSLIVAGPLKLIQGGEAIIARQALFSHVGAFPPERYQHLREVLPEDVDIQRIPNDFWGLATVLIDIPALYQSAGVDQVAERYPLAIRGRHGVGAAGDVFWGEASIFDQPTASVTVSFPGGEWVIAVRQETPALSIQALLILTSGVLGSVALAYAVAIRDARNRAQAESRAKSSFLSTMSHELRTPMNAIMGFAQILDYDDRLTPDQRESVHEILTASDHLLELINQVLDLAKIESGKLEVADEQIDVAALCEETRSLIEPIARQQNISLDLSLSAGLAVAADRMRLKQIVLNLLTNAVKYNNEGGHVSLTTSLRGEQVRILVEDNGWGISDADQAKLFEPFTRVGDRTRTTQGTGIGLAITKSLVLLMKGSIGLESALGVGSRFWVDLPKASAEVGESEHLGRTQSSLKQPAKQLVDTATRNDKGECNEQ